MATAIDEMLAGATILTGGSRAHSSLGVDADGWYWEHYDEGQIDRQAASEDDLRRLARDRPELLLPLLRRPHWRDFVQALADGQAQAAQDALRQYARHGDPQQHALLWSAILAWPGTPAAAEVVAQLRQRVKDYTLWHLFMEAHGWARGAPIRDLALAFLDKVLAIIGEVPDGEARLRSAFAGLDEERRS